jgi:hypothetical protein
MPNGKRPHLHLVTSPPDWWPEPAIVDKDDLRKATLALYGSIESIAEAFEFTPKQTTRALLLAVKMFLDNDVDEDDRAWFLDAVAR